MSRSQINLQDAFLNHVRKEKVPVTVNLSGGGKIEGLVKGFDNFVILMKHDGQHLIYKHAINTIVPERPVELAGHIQPSAQPPAEPVGHAPAGTASPADLVSPIPGPEGPAEVKTRPDAPAPEGPESTSVAPAESEEPWVEG